ncbi:MAG: ergothioneine biosynthesis protein EgtB [Hyphomicrobium sp.]|nr:ergothioneine biosynthesis protein EgtB [Hyphomicrobium sp.]
MSSTRPVEETRANPKLADRLFETRRLSLELARPLSAEDMTVQPMEDASPTKWHLAHVTWFFETFVLAKFTSNYKPFNESFNFCFNSYYEAVGQRQPRGLRGLLTRPSADDVMKYRSHVDDKLATLLANPTIPDGLAEVIEIGINHEQQHQELLQTDILSLFAANPLRPAYRAASVRSSRDVAEPMNWISYSGGIRKVGHEGAGFSWDNEQPRHDVLIRPFRLADRLVTNGEWLDFMADDGYRTPSLWLADGWTLINREQWRSPLYWEEHSSGWHQMSLEGLTPLQRADPVCHVSYFEADAFARWAGKRLPTEFEWEIAAEPLPVAGNTLATRSLRPLPAPKSEDPGRPRQMFGDVWEWTQSAYLPYPNYRPPSGAIGEYNGKFMVSQQVLRGASCATPDGHSRATYRNFFYPHQRWQFLGLRLAAELS